MCQGAANRKVAATNMNRASSRSHSVFTCIIESKVSDIVISLASTYQNFNHVYYYLLFF